MSSVDPQARMSGRTHCCHADAPEFCWNRRTLLQTSAAGFGGLALRYLLDRDRLLADDGARSVPNAQGEANRAAQSRGTPLAHHAARAKSVIFLFCYGGPSQVDLFDPKPALEKWDGRPIPVFHREDAFFPDTHPTAFQSPYRFEKHGASGIEISEKFPELARHADDLCVIRSMHSESNNHAPALFQLNTGFVRPGHPSFGAWVSYGLGSETENLPAFVVLCDPRGGPIGGAPNWSAGFLPPGHQATLLRNSDEPIVDLHPPRDVSAEQQRARRRLLAQINEEHLRRNPGEAVLAARIASYELAYRMQVAAPEAVDLSQESAATKKLYGLERAATHSFGKQCLLARRLVERGVRFVQLYSGGGHLQDCWDAHHGLKENHDSHCAETDQPIAGLLADLKQRGLLDSTLVVWGGEFGRMPTHQGTLGRDHNARGFSVWLAGGGIRGGMVHGATDEFGYAAIENPVSIPDLHATCLHLLGLDHRRLTVLHDGRQTRLTDVSGQVVSPLLMSSQKGD